MDAAAGKIDDGAVTGTGSGSDEVDAVPGLSPDPPDGPRLGSPGWFTLEVDGELFAVGPDGRGGTSYSWLSGPNEGYGYGESPAGPDRSLAEHRASIRGFLAQIDPATGYIGPD